MRQKYGLKGVDRVLHKLNRKIVQIKGASLAGLGRAAILVRRDMDRTPPMIPVDTGNLRASWYIEPHYAGMYVLCGFTANYAAFVHEMIGATFKRPGAGPKFFQSALYRNTGAMLDVIRQSVDI